MHLTPEELLDVAEGSRSVSSAPHLAECAACREQLDELRDAITTLAVAVPEPSPLFWDHLSERVRDGVAAERRPRRSWFGPTRWSWALAGAVSAAIIVLAASNTVRTPVPLRNASTVVDAPAADVGFVGGADDPSFNLLGDLAGSLDWESASEAGISMEVGAADSAVNELTDAERAELQRLLREAMSSADAVTG